MPVSFIYLFPRKGTLTYDDLSSKLDSRIQYINLIRPDEALCRELRLEPQQWIVSIQRTLRGDSRTEICDQIYLPYRKGMPLVETEIKYAEFPDLVKNKVSEFSVYTRMEIGVEEVRGEIAHRLDVPEGCRLMVICRYLVDRNDCTMAYGKQYLHPECGRIVAYSTNSEL